MKVLIIKTGATGDVVRTTVILHLYRNDDIVWITAKNNIAVLPFKQPNLKVLAIEDLDFDQDLIDLFDIVISLDDDIKCAGIASEVNTKTLHGAYLLKGRTVYSNTANEWFDMGLSSRFSKQQADDLKWQNRDTYQEIIFRMLGYKFNNEPYVIREDIKRTESNIIGIEARAGARWPTKIWNQYEQLANVLTSQGNSVTFFQEKPSIEEYMQDISMVNQFIGGDTLGMHIALGLGIPTVAIFTCTSSVEIHGYGIMEKVISPYLRDAFYKTHFIPEAVNSIKIDSVLEAVYKLKNHTTGASIS